MKPPTVLSDMYLLGDSVIIYIFSIRNNIDIIERVYVRFRILRVKGRLLARRSRNYNRTP